MLTKAPRIKAAVRKSPKKEKRVRKPPMRRSLILKGVLGMEMQGSREAFGKDDADNQGGQSDEQG